MRVEFRYFKGGNFTSWQTLFQEAADFASTLEPRQLISISHDTDHMNHSTVTVWYWSQALAAG